MTSYADAALFPYTGCYDQVWACNGSGSSGYSNMASATTPDGLSLTANGNKAKGGQMADLTWSGGSALTFGVCRDGNPIASGVSGNTGQKGAAATCIRFVNPKTGPIARISCRLTSRSEPNTGHADQGQRYI